MRYNCYWMKDSNGREIENWENLKKYGEITLKDHLMQTKT